VRERRPVPSGAPFWSAIGAAVRRARDVGDPPCTVGVPGWGRTSILQLSGTLGEGGGGARPPNKQKRRRTFFQKKNKVERKEVTRFEVVLAPLAVSCHPSWEAQIRRICRLAK
jgi:hypothetical protein